MKKKLLLTGASGFIGRYILKNLQEQNHDLEIYCTYKNNKLHNQFHWIQADLLSEEDIKNVLANIKPDYLIHLAWFVEHKNFWAAKENYDWFIASTLFLKYFQENGGKFFIGSGTFCEYLLNQKAGNNNYSKCKDLLRNFVQNFSAAHELNYAWCRIFSAFGEGEPATKLITSVIEKLKNDQEVIIGTPQNFLDFIYADDIAKMILDVLFKQQFGLVDIGTGISTSIKNVVEKIAEILGKSKLLINFREQNADIISIKANQQIQEQNYLEERLKIMINNLDK